MTTLQLSRNATRSPRNNTLLLLGVLLLLVVATVVMTSVLKRPSAPLNEAQIAAFLRDDADPSGIVHALSQVRTRVGQGERLDRWAPELMRLSSHPAEEVRHATAELMGLDPSRPEFRQKLLEMLRSQTVLVRNTAALSLAAFGDNAGREMIVNMLEPIRVDAPTPGHVETVARPGRHIDHGEVLVRLHSGNSVFNVLAPVSGHIRAMAVENGDMVSGGSRIAVIEPGADELLAALRALERIGKPQDLTAIAALAANQGLPDAVREQAKAAERKIRERSQ
ncbi:MAG: biotin/lipoyl-containing protein [Terriglobales bacterium]